METIKQRFSIWWLVVVLNIIVADIIGFLNPGTLQTMMQLQPAQELLLVFSLLFELPILMIAFSRILPYSSNRIANMVVAVLTIVFVIGGGNSSSNYIFFASIEVGCLLLILWWAWTWRKQKAEG